MYELKTMVSFKIHLQKLFLFFCELRERNLAHQNQEVSKSRDPQNTRTTDTLCLSRFQILPKSLHQTQIGGYFSKMSENDYQSRTRKAQSAKIFGICLKKSP